MLDKSIIFNGGDLINGDYAKDDKYGRPIYKTNDAEIKKIYLTCKENNTKCNLFVMSTKEGNYIAVVFSKDVNKHDIPHIGASLYNDKIYFFDNSRS